MRCGSGLSKGLCLICENNQNSLSISKNSSQSPPLINHHCCYEYGNPLDGIFCKWCTCKSCRKGAHIGYNCPPKVSVISNPEPCNNQTIDELPQTLPCFDLTCYSGNESPFTCDSTPNIFDDFPNVFNPPPQPPKYSYEFCGNDAYYGYDCPLQQQYLCCTHCGGPHEACQCDQLIFDEPYCENCEASHMSFQCQPMNEDCYHEQNSCYNSNSFGFDQFLPQQFLFIDQTPFEESMKNLRIAFQAWSENIQQKRDEEEKYIAEDQYWKIPICYDDDEDYTIAITPKEPDNSLSMGDEHLDTISTTKSDEFIKSSVKNLVPNPSESKGEHECDVPACDDFTTFSNLLFDADDDFSYSNNESFFDEGLSKKIYLNHLFNEEIIFMKIDPHHFNTESDHIESLLNHDSSIISSSSKTDSLLDEFVGKLTLLKSIPPRINETDCDPVEETRLIKRLLYDNSSPRPPEGFISKNSDVTIKSFSPSPIPEDDYDSERDILILEELLSHNSLSLPKNESFHFDILSSPRPPTKPPDGNSRIFNVKVMGVISEHKVPMPRLMLTQPTLVPNKEKSPKLLPHLGYEASQPSTKCPMMINGRNTPILDVPFLFPLTSSSMGELGQAE
uniref:Pre-mRNA splicing Prp18-interacting factor n=1 Tax=Tanacetum cinerariifolium TaxID=118510 RepID=A0A699H3R9_TANCI|nr:hypothetical protein [Tanacetum cinerariifolium]